MRNYLHASHYLFLVIGIFWQTSAWSGQNESKQYLTAGIELFRWLEFDSKQRRLLSEQGTRLSLRANWDNILPQQRFGQINLKGYFYNGRLNYDGQTQSTDPSLDQGIFVASISEYKGFGAELEHTHSINHDTRFLVNLGVEFWSRDIKNSIDTLGNLIGGLTETYQLLYTRIGLQQQYKGSYGHIQTRFGIKVPLRVNERVLGLTLHPTPRIWSPFASYRLFLADRRNSIIEIYYDSLRLDPSPPATDTKGNSWLQPKSHYDRIGIMIGFPF